MQIGRRNGILVESVKTLNIKNPETYQLAEAISAATGQTMTHVVTEALRDSLARLQRLQRKTSVDELLSIANRVSCHITRPYLDHASYLYDENGLPK